MDELIRHYRDGASLRDLAARYNVAVGTVRGRLHRAGEPLRRPGAPRLQVDVTAVVRETRLAGSSRRAALSLGVSRSTVGRRLAEIHGEGQSRS